MNKSPKKASTVAVGVRLDVRMVEWLKEQEGGSTGAIKDAIEMLMFARSLDGPTNALMRDIALLVLSLKNYGGGLDWYESPRAFDALAEAVRAWLERARPAKATGEAEDLLAPLDPVTLGRVVAQMLFDQQMFNRPGWENPFGSGTIYKKDRVG